MFAPCAPWFCLYVLCEHTYGMKLFSREHIYIYHIISYHMYIYICMYVYIYICTRPCHHPPSPPHGMGPMYWPHMRSSPSPPRGVVGVWHCPPPPPLWCGGGVVWYVGYVWCVWSVWYGMFGKYGMFGMYGMYRRYGMSGWYCMDGRYGM